MSDEVALQSIEDPGDFWDHIDSALATSCRRHEDLDDVLRTFLGLASTHRYEYLNDERGLAQCCYRLLDSDLFQQDKDYIRRQFLYCLLQEDEVDMLYLAAAVCLYDGRNDETVFELMKEEGAFAQIVNLIATRPENDAVLHRLLLELLFEMARVQNLKRDELAIVNDEFILYLFQLIEALSDDADDPYHYPVIRVLLILNEQYMCFAGTSNSPTQTPGLTNRILKLLSAHGPSYRTFGENLILLLNREAALGPQLLILKLLYLLFTTPPTYEYFYTNDLHVLVDVIIRNLLDLDLGTFDNATEDLTQDGQRALRHTYLRVLCPLLKNTQLSREGSHYKREELRKLLDLLVNSSSTHFAPVDETIVRLVLRCKQIPWLKVEGEPEDAILEQKLAGEQVAKKLLGMSLDTAGESSLSLLDVSAKMIKQRPSVPAPRRQNRRVTTGLEDSSRGESTSQQLAVPRTASNVSEAMQEKERSPFADEDDADR